MQYSWKQHQQSNEEKYCYVHTDKTSQRRDNFNLLGNLAVGC